MYLAHMAYKALMHGVEQDIHAIVEEDATIKAIHEHAEQFDPKVEFAFGICRYVFEHSLHSQPDACVMHAAMLHFCLCIIWCV